jgi:glycosyltransferase involved in cell wall biosynthesis
MRIVHVMTHLRLGAGRAIVDLCLEQCARGHDVQVALSSDADGAWASAAGLIAELKAGNVPVAAIGDTFHRDPGVLSDAAKQLRAVVGTWTGDTVAHAHTAMTGAVAHWAGAPRLVVTCHGWDLTRPAAYDLQDALALTLAGAIVSPSKEWAQRVAALAGGPRVTVVPNGFDLSRYPPRPTRAGDPNNPRIVCVGEVTRRKGQDLLIIAMPVIWQTMPEASLEIIGDGDMTADIQALARRLDPAGHRIRLRGHLPQPYLELADADVFCLPSRSDNQPVAIIEALLAGLPVVSTDVGGIPEMIEGADAGIIVGAESPDALADGLLRVLSRGHDPARSARATTFATREYDIAAMADRIEAVYRSCSPRSSGQPSTSAAGAVDAPLRQS